jgi:hypothetical protein
MIKTFELYRRVGKKEILRQDYATLDEALNFLDKERTGFVVDSDGNECSKEKLEELLYAESIRSETRTKYDKYFTDFNEVFEGTDREVSGADSDNAESSTERDN